MPPHYVTVVSACCIGNVLEFWHTLYVTRSVFVIVDELPNVSPVAKWRIHNYVFDIEKKFSTALQVRYALFKLS